MAEAPRPIARASGRRRTVRRASCETWDFPSSGPPSLQPLRFLEAGAAHTRDRPHGLRQDGVLGADVARQPRRQGQDRRRARGHHHRRRRQAGYLRRALEPSMPARFPDYPPDALAYRGGYERCGDRIGQALDSFALESLLAGNPEVGTWIVDEAAFFDERLAYLMKDVSTPARHRLRLPDPRPQFPARDIQPDGAPAPRDRDRRLPSHRLLRGGPVPRRLPVHLPLLSRSTASNARPPTSTLSSSSGATGPRRTGASRTTARAATATTISREGIHLLHAQAAGRGGRARRLKASCPSSRRWRRARANRGWRPACVPATSSATSPAPRCSSPSACPAWPSASSSTSSPSRTCSPPSSSNRSSPISASTATT